MEERVNQELELLRKRYLIDHRPDGNWVRVISFPLPLGWNREATDVAFQIPVGYPGTPPYGIYVPAGLTFNGQPPDNYKEPAPTQPPFGEVWGILSWQPETPWRATAEMVSGSNLMNWVQGFGDRFREGR
jgi:hypothetical protein